MTLKFDRVRAVVKEHVRAMSYLAYRERNSDENNTVHRYHEDSNKHLCGMQLCRAIRHHTFEIIDAAFRNNQLTVSTQAFAAEYVTTLIQTQAL